MEEVLRTGDPVRASCAVATLADAGIEAFIVDVHTHIMIGGGDAIPRRVLTASEDASRARWVLKTQDPLIDRAP